MLNTAFVDNFNHRIYKQDLDFAKDDPNFPDDFILDLFFSTYTNIQESEPF